MRIFARRERPHPGARLSLFEHEDGYRYQLWVTNLPAITRGWRGQTAYIDAGHRVHARVEDCIRTGKDTGIGRFPSHGYAFNQAWLTAAMIAQILLAWLKLLALDGDLARAEPKTLRYRVLNAAARLVLRRAAAPLEIPRELALDRGDHPGLAAHLRTTGHRLTSTKPVPATRAWNLWGLWKPRHPARQPGPSHTQTLKSPLSPRFWRRSAAASDPCE